MLLNTGLFEPMRANATILRASTDRSWDEPKLAVLTGWMGTVIERIRLVRNGEPKPGNWVTSSWSFPSLVGWRHGADGNVYKAAASQLPLLDHGPAVKPCA